MTDRIQYNDLTPNAIRRYSLLTNNGHTTIYARKVGRGYQVESEALDDHTWSIIEPPGYHATVSPENETDDSPEASPKDSPDDSPEDSSEAALTPNPEAPAQKPYTYIPLDMTDPNPYQPRQQMDPDGIENLARGLRLKRDQLPDTYGLMQIPLARLHAGRYQLAFGHRRKAAFDYNNQNHAPLDGLPPEEQAEVKNGIVVGNVYDWSAMPLFIIEATDEEMYDYAARENSDRVDLDPIEKAQAIKQSIAEFGWSLSQAANAHGLSKSGGSNLTRLLQLPEQVQHLIATGSLGQRHARAILKLSQTDSNLNRHAIDLAKNCVEADAKVADVEHLVANILAQYQQAESMKEKMASLECYSCHNQTIQPDPAGHGEAITCTTCHKKWLFIQLYEIEAEKHTPGGTLYCMGCGHAQEVSKYIKERFYESLKCTRCRSTFTLEYWLSEPLEKAETLDCPKCDKPIIIATAEQENGLIICPSCEFSYQNYHTLNAYVASIASRKQEEWGQEGAEPWDDSEPCYKCGNTPEPDPTSEQIYCDGCGSTWHNSADYVSKKNAYLEFAAQAQMALPTSVIPDPSPPDGPVPPEILDLVRSLAHQIASTETARQTLIDTRQVNQKVLNTILKPNAQILPALRTLGSQTYSNSQALAGLSWLLAQPDPQKEVAANNP